MSEMVEQTLEQRQQEHREVCAKIAALAKRASDFACSGSAGGAMNEIMALARKAHAISGHRIGLGSTFMDCPEANVFRFGEQVQLEEDGYTVAFVRGRKSPFMPAQS